MHPNSSSKDNIDIWNASRSSSIGIGEIITEEDEADGVKTIKKGKRFLNSTSADKLGSARSGAFELGRSLSPVNISIVKGKGKVSRNAKVSPKRTMPGKTTTTPFSKKKSPGRKRPNISPQRVRPQDLN